MTGSSTVDFVRVGNLESYRHLSSENLETQKIREVSPKNSSHQVINENQYFTF